MSRNDWDRVERDITRSPGGVLKWTFLFLFGFAVVGYGIKVIFFPVNTVMGVAEKVMAPGNIIHNYEYFYAQAESIRSMGTQYKIAKQAVIDYEELLSDVPKSEWDYTDKTEWARLNQVSTGIKLHANEMIRDYNAKAKMVSRNIFKTGNTPFAFELIQ